jgi:PAS domain S-box-containing protein
MDQLNALPGVVFQYHFTEKGDFCVDSINTPIISLLGMTPGECYTNPELFLANLSAGTALRKTLKECCELYCCISQEISLPPKTILLQVSPLETDYMSACGLLIDITVQVKAREEAIKKVNFLTFVQDQLSDMFYYKDRNSKFLGGNLAWSRYHGADNPALLIGKTDYDSKILSQHDKEKLFKEEQEMMANASDIRIRECHLQPSGQYFYCESVKTSLCDADGNVVGLVGISRDITAQVEAEVALKKAQEEAMHLAQVKSSFLAVMSHEIRTPMNGVIGCASLLGETPLNEEQQQLLHTIQSSGESLLVIINDILDFSKIDAGKMEFDHSPFDLRTLIEECLELFSKQVNEKGLEINYLLSPDLPACMIGDASRIRQVINNILGNAIKFTEKGEVFVEVTPIEINSGPENCEFLIAIKDTGIGIAKENQTQLFNAFSQADNSITRRYGGTGLGLAISKKIAEQMGGRLWFESELNKGSTFYFSLKLDFDPKYSVSESMNQIQSFKDLRVLIVDDNATNRRVLSTTLLQWGMQVAAFDSAGSALENLKLGQQYDLVILDFCMPTMNGGTLSNEIRRSSLKNKPIIILSSANVSRTEWPNIDVVLMKPVRTNTLKRTLLNLLGQSENKQHFLMKKMSTNKSTRILIVEDNSVNQMVATMMLKKLGFHKISCVSDGQEAVDVIGQRDVDIILMDIQMDRMDGYTATRLIRKNKLHSSKPWIIALTAGVQVDDSVKAYESGMNDFITKPIQIKELEDALNKAINEITTCH